MLAGLGDRGAHRDACASTVLRRPRAEFRVVLLRQEEWAVRQFHPHPSRRAPASTRRRQRSLDAFASSQPSKDPGVERIPSANSVERSSLLGCGSGDPVAACLRGDSAIGPKLGHHKPALCRRLLRSRYETSSPAIGHTSAACGSSTSTSGSSSNSPMFQAPTDPSWDRPRCSPRHSARTRTARATQPKPRLQQERGHMNVACPVNQLRRQSLHRHRGNSPRKRKDRPVIRRSVAVMPQPEEPATIMNSPAVISSDS